MSIHTTRVDTSTSHVRFRCVVKSHETSSSLLRWRPRGGPAGISGPVPKLEEIVDTEEGARRPAGFLVRRYADRMVASKDERQARRSRAPNPNWRAGIGQRTSC